MVKTLFLVGEDYGNSELKYHTDKYCLTGKSGETLAHFAGMDRLEFLARTQRMNVVDMPEDWPIKIFVEAGVARIKANIQPRQSVILLGRRVAEAFGLESLALFEWYPWEHSARVALAPHPSGRNRLLNDPMMKHQYQTFMSSAFA